MLMLCKLCMLAGVVTDFFAMACCCIAHLCIKSVDGVLRR